MTPAADQLKKAELIQLRVEKPFLDQLNAIATEQQLPLSVMLRAWLSERLRLELTAVNDVRTKWHMNRLQEIQKIMNSDYLSAPLLVVHAFPLVPGAELQPEKVRGFSSSLLYNCNRSTGRINRFGYEVFRESENKLIEKAQVYKTGEIELASVISKDQNGQSLQGLGLDHGIVSYVQSYVGFLDGVVKLPPPYLFRVSILGAKGLWLTAGSSFISSFPHVPFEEDCFTLRDIVVTDFGQTGSQTKTAQHIKLALDELWHASGLPGSASFTDDGEWRSGKSV